MAILRCPYCGEKVNQGDLFCSHCGKEFDKPHVDDYATNNTEAGGLILKAIGFVLLFFILSILIGFVTHTILGMTVNYWFTYLLSFVLAVIVVLLFKKKS